MFSSSDFAKPLYEENPNKYIAIAIDNSSEEASIFLAMLESSSRTVSFGTETELPSLMTSAMTSGRIIPFEFS